MMLVRKIKELLLVYCVTIPKYIESIHDEVKSIKELLMTIQEDLKNFATQVDDVTNAIAANVTVVSTKITDLQAQIAAGSITSEELSEALDPVKAHLQTVADNLATVATAGTTTTPVVEPL